MVHTNVTLASPTSAQEWHSQVDIGLMLESTPIAIVVVDQAGQIVYGNAKLTELFGYDSAELIGQKVELLMPMRFHRIHEQHRAAYSGQPHVRSMGSGMDLVGRHKNGREFPIEAGLSYLQTKAAMFVIATIIDVSRRKEIEASLERRVEERTREIERRQQVAEGLRDILAILNSNRSLTEILEYIVHQARWLLQADASMIYGSNEPGAKMAIQASIGLSQAEFTQATQILDEVGSQSLPPQLQPLVINQANEPAALPEHQRWLAELCHRTHLTIPIRLKSEIYGGLMLCYDDARTFSQEELELATGVADQTALAIENAWLHTQIERSAVAAERSRLARELHDAVTQTLFSASLIADVLPRLWKRHPDEANRRLEELRDLTRGALAEMRTLLLELRPAKLIEVELTELLQQLATALAGRARLPIAVNVAGTIVVPTDVKIAFYRIAQEALNNVAKHAQAHQVEIRLQGQQDTVELMVCDDGCGFVFASIAPENLGLGIMRERAEDVGATLKVISTPGKGTQVLVKWSNK